MSNTYNSSVISKGGEIMENHITNLQQFNFMDHYYPLIKAAVIAIVLTIILTIAIKKLIGD